MINLIIYYFSYYFLNLIKDSDKLNLKALVHLLVKKVIANFHNLITHFSRVNFLKNLSKSHFIHIIGISLNSHLISLIYFGYYYCFLMSIVCCHNI
jgi:hypothetical protein